MTIPRRELVGRNARLEDEVYLDDYMTELNQFASVDEVFGQYKDKIAKGDNIIGAVVMKTLGKSEWENHLVSLVMTAAKVGEWRAVSKENQSPGLDAISEKHYGFVVKYQEKIFLLPSALYVAYCQAKLE